MYIYNILYKIKINIKIYIYFNIDKIYLFIIKNILKINILLRINIHVKIIINNKFIYV